MPAHFDLSVVLLDQLRKAAEAEGLSVDRFVALAIAEKLARSEHTSWLGRNEPGDKLQLAGSAIWKQPRDRASRPIVQTTPYCIEVHCDTRWDWLDSVAKSFQANYRWRHLRMVFGAVAIAGTV